MENSIFLDRQQACTYLGIPNISAQPIFDFWDLGLSISQLHKCFGGPDQSPQIFSASTHEDLLFWRDIATPQWQTMTLRKRVLADLPHRNDVNTLKPARVIVMAAILYWKHTGKHVFTEPCRVLTGSWANNGRNFVFIDFAHDAYMDIVVGAWPKEKEVIALD